MSQLPTSATGVLELFSTSKQGVEQFSRQIIDAVKSGDIDPLKVRVWVKTIESIAEIVNKATKGNQLTAADKYPDRIFEAYGASVEKSEIGTKYDFTVCGDDEWEQFQVAEESAKASRIEREKFLRALPGPTTIVDESTGEVRTIRPPSKKSEQGLKITIK